MRRHVVFMHLGEGGDDDEVAGAGAAGGATSFGALLSAPGGSGGTSSNAAGGVKGTASSLAPSARCRARSSQTVRTLPSTMLTSPPSRRTNCLQHEQSYSVRTRFGGFVPSGNAARYCSYAAAARVSLALCAYGRPVSWLVAEGPAFGSSAEKNPVKPQYLVVVGKMTLNESSVAAGVLARV